MGAHGMRALEDAAARLTLPPGAALRFSAVGEIAGDVAASLPPDLARAAPRRQAGFAAGRRAAAMALAAAGSGITAVGMGADRLPLWPPGWIGSITHTDDVAAAVVAPARAVRILGLDLEPIMPDALATQIAPQIVPEGLSPSDLPPGVELTRAFSAKEALYKALFPETRQIREFSAATYARDGGAPVLTLSDDWGPDWPRGTALRAGQAVAAGHVLTVLWR